MTENWKAFPFHYYFDNFPCWLEILFDMLPSSFIADYNGSTDKQGKKFFFHFCKDLHKGSAL